MSRAAPLIALFLAGLTSPARALPAEQSPEMTAALSPLIAAIMGGVACDRKVDWKVGGNFLRSKIGDAVRLDADDVSYVVWMAYAQQSMQKELGALPSNQAAQAKYCATVTSLYGSRGSSIRSLVSDK